MLILQQVADYGVAIENPKADRLLPGVDPSRCQKRLNRRQPTISCTVHPRYE